MLHKNSLSYSLSGRKWTGQNLTMNLIYDLTNLSKFNDWLQHAGSFATNWNVSKLPGYS